MFNNIFNSPSRSYAQKQNHQRTPPKLKRPTEVPLPPSPPPTESAQQTPSLGIDHALALSPATDTLATPDRTPMSRVGQDDGLLTTNTLSTFGLNTPTKSRDGDSTNEAGKSRVPVLEDFELIRVVGKGCAGRVMMVRHTETAKIQAMKAISKRSVLTYDELDHTLTEVRILKQFAKYEPNNPFIVKLNYAFMDKENIYFVMDFYPGGDLATQMEIGRLGHTRTRFYAVDITQGLIDLHRHGIIVRDLKPENILLKSDGHAVLADFGLSKQFSYRGEPAPVTIPIYPGQPSLPYWAGAGLGSVRPNHTGRPRIMIDRAESFVGTAEYIAPEVVKRAEYTYAVDWWALGIIMIEGLFGRVPYRQHADEPPTMLWDQILLDPWQVIFDHHDVARIDLHEENIDAPTLEFIDGLLQKDANHRLTEPCVVQHPFFYGIEWDMVISGGYVDPSPLTLHPVPEYNLHYFPRLCLQETPTVDMTAHDSERPEVDDGDPTRKTPLNDPLTYAMEHRRAREAFKDFEWSRDDVIDWQHGADREGHHPSAVEGDDGHGYEGEEEEEADGEGYAETDGIDGLTLNWSVSEAADQLAGAIQDLDMPAIPGLSAGDIDYDSEGATRPTSTDFTPHDGLVNTIDIDVVPASTVLSSSDQLPNGDSDTQSHSPTAPPIEISSPPLSPTRDSIPPTSPKTIKVPSPRPKTKLRLPSGLPASGLSSSDIVSIPSPDPNSPTRLVRRNPLGMGHASRPSIDTVHTLTMANPRLSVDLHGTISQLGDEDWEKLETGSIPSIPNAAPSAFFTRGFGTLRRRPSAINTAGGGFRRPHKHSGSSNSASGDSSPTKGNSRHRQLFTVKSIENTKKAFKTLKAFPRMISHSRPKHPADGQAKSTTPSRVTTPTSPPVPRMPAKYGPVSAPNTSTGSWFTNRRLGISRSFRPSRSNTTSSSESTRSSTKTSAYVTPNPNAVPDREVRGQGQKQEVPRVELIHSPPVNWDLSSGATKDVEETKAGGAEGNNGGDKTKEVQGEGKVVGGETKESTENSTAAASA